MPANNPAAYALDPRYASGTQGDEYLRQVLGGQFLGEGGQGNPYLDQYLADATRQLEQQRQQGMAQVNAQALRPGKLGGSWYQQQAGNVGQQFADASAQAQTAARMQAYEAERQRQQEAAGMSGSRDAAIWGDLSTRRGQDLQKQVSQSASAAANASAWRQGEIARQQMEMDQAYRQAQLQEQARQFDVNAPMGYGNLLANVLGGYSGSQQGDLGQLASLMGQQYGQQAGSVGGYGNMLGQQGQLGMGAAGMIPGMAQAGLPYAQAAAGLFGQLDSNAAARAAAAGQLGLARDQMQWQSILGQQQSQDPMAQLAQFLPFLGAVGGFAGQQVDRTGTQPGVPQPYQSSSSGLMGGALGGLMSGMGMMGMFGGG